jgi:hypothetical protein
MVSLVPVLSWAAVIVATAVAIARGPSPPPGAFIIDRLLRYAFLFPVGFLGVWAAIGHIFFPGHAARAIGWQPSPFQFEVGVANLGMGLAGFYAAFRSFEARVATAIALACFLIGAGIGHVREIVGAENFAPGNAGPILFTDLLTPIAIFALLWLSHRLRPQRRND